MTQEACHSTRTTRSAASYATSFAHNQLSTTTQTLSRLSTPAISVYSEFTVLQPSNYSPTACVSAMRVQIGVIALIVGLAGAQRAAWSVRRYI
jgi:hypothetical protein